MSGVRVEAEELRGGAALIVAGLAAEGKTIIQNSCFIERGYENIGYDLSCLGGRIQMKEQVGK